MAEGDEYRCDRCRKKAPAFDNLTILEWRGGEMAHFGISDDPLMLMLRCPACREKYGDDD